MNIRSALDSDLPEIVVIDCAGNPHAWAQQHFQNALMRGQIHVLEKHHRVIAFAVWQSIADEAELHLLATHPNWRRQGAASLLLDDFVKENPDVRRLLLEVRAGNIPAICLYRRHGFVEIARRKDYYTQPVEDALIMEKLC